VLRSCIEEIDAAENARRSFMKSGATGWVIEMRSIGHGGSLFPPGDFDLAAGLARRTGRLEARGTHGSRVREEREVNGGDNRPHKGPEGLAMVQVREKSRFGPCYALGELIGETATRYIYSNRAGTAFVSKSSSIHLAPCAVCADYQESDEAA
jgi:hypothetical protein